MKIAHISDLHLLSLEGIPVRAFANKRLTGLVNLRLKRGSIHRSEYVRAIAREIGRIGVDHVVVTGDLTNLSLDPEFELAREILACDLAMPADHVSVVPGNHDAYTADAYHARRFQHHLRDWLRSDLPELTGPDGHAFPVVKLRGEAAIIALSSAVPRPPFVAAGEVGRAQLESLSRALAHPEVARRVAVVAVHHPVVHPWPRVKAYLEGLRDGPALLAQLRRLSRGLILHGHLHRRIQRDVATDSGKLQQVGATSASLHHHDPDRMAGFNVYESDGAGVIRVGARVLDPATGAFRTESVPKYV